MDWDTAANAFSALGSEARLQVLRALVRAGPDGLTVAEVQARTDLAASTLTHHLKFLIAAGVVSQERQGRSLITRANVEALEALGQFLVMECCADNQKRAANDG